MSQYFKFLRRDTAFFYLWKSSLPKQYLTQIIYPELFTAAFSYEKGLQKVFIPVFLDSCGDTLEPKPQEPLISKGTETLNSHRH